MSSATIDLTPERWSRVEALFDEATDLPASERHEFVASACRDDPELGAYIRTLLDTAVAEDTTIGELIGGALEQFDADAAPKRADRSGERIGQYRLVRRIGAGGMAVVYLAERADEQFEQKVAIKLVSHRVLDPEVDERTRVERQILAALDHPNIARLLDGGTAGDGLPYIVMEYIEGVPIDRYCDSRQLSIDARLDLFERICGAVHYAHQNLVVHRDIKPSNILVTGDGTPKLLDFGIAKQIDAKGMPTDGLTRDGFAMMTPENATPEQLLGKPVTTATDVYALGVLLYRLLTGFAPLPTDGRPPAEFARTICFEAPEPPSRAVGRRSKGKSVDAASGLSRICDARRTTPERLARALKGDIDNILLVALRKEPERRYRSVNQFAEDLKRHRRSMPVVARPDTFTYRAGKFVRRHYAAVASSVVLAAVIVAFSVVTWFQNVEITRERDTAREVSQFLEEIFMEPDPARARGLDITAKEILANGADRIQRQLSERPEIQAALMETIGRVYFNLGQYDESVAMHESSLNLRAAVFGEEHGLVAQSGNQLAETLIRKGDYARAAALLEDAIAVNEAALVGDGPALADSFHILAELQLAEGHLEEAEAAARRSLEIRSAAAAEQPLHYSESAALVGRVLQVKGELDDAETLFREAIETLREHTGSNHPTMAIYLQNLGVLLLSNNDLAEAEKALNESIDLKRRLLGPEHDSIANTLVILGGLYHRTGAYARAEESLRGAIDIHREALGEEHQLIGYDLTSLGMLLHDAGRLDEAEEALRGALDIYDAALDPHHQFIGSTLTELGGVLNTKNRSDLALPLLTRAVEIRSRDFPRDHALHAGTLVAYGDTLARLGRFDDAEAELLPSYEALEGRGGRRERQALLALVRLYERWERPEDAARFRQRVAAAARSDDSA